LPPSPPTMRRSSANAPQRAGAEQRQFVVPTIRFVLFRCPKTTSCLTLRLGLLHHRSTAVSSVVVRVTPGPEFLGNIDIYGTCLHSNRVTGNVQNFVRARNLKDRAIGDTTPVRSSDWNRRREPRTGIVPVLQNRYESSAEAGQATALGCDTKSPNQFVIVISGMMRSPVSICSIVSYRGVQEHSCASDKMNGTKRVDSQNGLY
jgi:hypothetical protein